MSETQANQITVSGMLDPQLPETEFHFADGRVVRLPTALLRQTAHVGSGLEAPGEADPILIPVVEEQLQVTGRIVETGKVRLQKSVETYDVKLDEPLAVKRWQIERLEKHQVVEEAPLTRHEGETTIYPVVEERLVLTKELVLVEEIHVTRAMSERRDTQTVVLRRETLQVERDDLGNGPR